MEERLKNEHFKENKEMGSLIKENKWIQTVCTRNRMLILDLLGFLYMHSLFPFMPTDFVKNGTLLSPFSICSGHHCPSSLDLSILKNSSNMHCHLIKSGPGIIVESE